MKLFFEHDSEIPHVSRKSAGIFGYLNFFQSTAFQVLLFLGLPLCVGLFVMCYHGLRHHGWDWMYLWRDGLTFMTITMCGTISCYLLRKKTPLFNIKMAFLINAYGTGMFAISYMLGFVVTYLLERLYAVVGIGFVEIFFMIGALISYIVLFVVYFSFTNVGPPWYILLALIQPVVGIILYSFFEQQFSLFSSQINIIFFLKAMIFFTSSALIFALVYAPAMAYVSLKYRKPMGIGGYNFIRAFVAALLTENQEDQIEKFFENVGEARDLKLQYIALREQQTKKIKSIFLIPNVHFGPFKTSGSASLAEDIYRTFPEIPGMTVLHTTVSHGQNFTSHHSNQKVLTQIREDIAKMQFQIPNMSHFLRVSKDKAKLLGTVINGVPLLLYTLHPLPTDDIIPEVGARIKAIVEGQHFKEPLVVDCHNSLIGDEILVEPDSPEAHEMYEITKDFCNQINQEQENLNNNPLESNEVLYSVERDPLKEFVIGDGIGAGGIIVHLFKIKDQETALIHIDANNATTPVRSAMVNLSENLGLNRIELSTSDTHAVVRILSSQGYFPLGTKIHAEVLVEKVRQLITKARQNYTKIEIATFLSSNPNYRFWKDISYFEVIMGTIERCLVVSKILLTIGLIIPTFITVILSLFLF